MVELLDFLKISEILIGLMVLLFSTLTGGFVWWDKRSRKYVDGRTSAIEGASLRVTERLDRLETDFQRLEKDVTGIRQAVSQLPTSREFSDLKAELSGMRAMQTQQHGMLQTLYEAALRASTEGRSK